MRIEAAAHRGKPVYWALIGPWTVPDRTTQAGSLPDQKANAIGSSVFFALLAGAALLARRNLKLGRGDRRGAVRLAIVFLGALTAGWVIGEHHVPTAWEQLLFFVAIGGGLFLAGGAWVLYLAIEPFVRRRWPGVLVSWSRLLEGRFRDPLVGRALLVGSVCGVVMAIWDGLVMVLPPLIGHPQIAPFRADVQLGALAGARSYITFVVNTLIGSVGACFGYLFLFLPLQMLVRKRWAAAVLIALIYGLPALQLDPLLTCFIATAVWGGMLMFVLVRFGFLAIAVAMVFISLLVFCPINADMSAWYFGIELTGLALLLGLAIYGFHTSLGGQSMFGRASLGD